MQYQKLTANKYIVRVLKDEELMSSLLQFFGEVKATSATFSAIGAVKNPVIAYYNLQTKEYEKKTMEEFFELVSLTGNLGEFDGKPVLHIHLVIADKEHKAFGGHLFEAPVSATAEVVVETFDIPLVRKFNEETGLNLLELSETL